MSAPATIIEGGRVLRHGSKRPEALTIVIGDDGRILDLTAGAPAVCAARRFDATGKLVTPGLVDMHQHLDKTRTLHNVPNPEGTLLGAVKAFSRYAAGMTPEDLLSRAERTMKECLVRGTTVIRTHANIDADLETRGVETLIGLRDGARDRISLQVVAFVTSGSLNDHDKARHWLDEAISMGADAVGGAPSLTDDPAAYLDILFEAAVRAGLPIDLHLDEHLDSSRQLFDSVIERTEKYGLQGRVVLGHCSVLSALPSDTAQPIIEGLAAAGIGVVTLPTANLFLQGRGADRLPPRGLTRVRELRAAGVKVAAASDNIQDPFVPVGSGDMLEIARLTLLAAHLGADDLEVAFTMVSETPAALCGLGTNYGIRAGARADLLFTDAQDAADLVAGGAVSRAVMVGGRFVAGNLQEMDEKDAYDNL